MDAIEKVKIAKDVANYIIDHLLVNQPMTAAETESTVMEVTEDRVNVDAHEIADIVAFAVNYISTDVRVEVTPRGEIDKPVIWYSHKSI